MHPDHFAQHLEVLGRVARCLPLPEFLAKCRGGTLPRNAVAVTFDDGYADNLLAALPLLERHRIPATVFVQSGFIGAAVETWWDRLEQAVLLPDELPERLVLALGGEAVTWSRPEGPLSAAQRQQLHGRLYEALARLDVREREAALMRLFEQLGTAPSLRPSHRPLDRDELRHLAASPLITIGAHTRTHPQLSRLGAARQAEELQQGKADLEAWLAKPVDLVAYPHGAHDATTLDATRAAGYTAGFTTEPRVVPHRPDFFRMPRINIEDQDGKSFATTLRWFRLAA